MKRPKGVLLVGGTGSRLYPLTTVVNKHLLPVYDKPLVYYSLGTIMLAGAREIAIVTAPTDRELFVKLFGDGGHLGIDLTYVEQPTPSGIGNALARCADFLGRDRCVMVLGDNLFHGAGFGMSLGDVGSDDAATIFAYTVADPRPYAVIELGPDGEPLQIVEKPESPTSHWVVPGLYFLPPGAASLAAGLPMSARGESEITDLNRHYLERGKLEVIRANRGSMWTDVGAPDRLFIASTYVESIAHRQGHSIACPEEIAFRRGWIDQAQLEVLAAAAPDSLYGNYLRSVAHRNGGDQ
jgi:glucose-1-phosphate thymidylyltransferase